MAQENVTLAYKFGGHKKKPNRIVFEIDDTDIDLANYKHYQFVKSLAEVMAVHMYAKAHDVDMDKIKFTCNDTQEKQG